VSTRPIVYYITAHGYGHGVRSADILNAIGRLCARVPRIVVSALPPDFLESRLDTRPDRIVSRALDVGMVQLDSIRIDMEASRAAADELLQQWEARIVQERQFLESVDAGCAVADIPAIPLEAARAGNRPAIAVGNFSWDWIYEPFVESDPRWAPIVERFRRSYEHADLLLRLPFSGPMTVFCNREEIPLLSAPATARRDDLRRMTPANPGKKWVLLAFGTLDWEARALDRIESIAGVEFFCVHPLAWPGRRIHSVDRASMRFPDVLASMDAVVSKPGYGIVSECIVNRKPLLHSARRDFREYPILVAAIERYLKQRRISEEQLYSGDLSRELELLWEAPEPDERMPTGGAEIAARRILDLAVVDP
jgi:L-arabinokinase